MKVSLAALLFVSSAVAQESWTRIDPPQRPTRRWGHAMAYDAARRVVVMFGGDTNNGMSSETWEWNGQTWTLRTFSVRPEARIDHGMVYDSVRHVIVLFGGVAYPSRLLPDTWEYDGTGWQRKHTMPANEERVSMPMAYDSLRQRVVRFGGRAGGGLTSDTWVWTGFAWTNLVIPGPPARDNAKMVYDSLRDRMVMFGGDGLSGALRDTWEFDGTRWIQRFPTMVPDPGARYAMAYDAAVGRTITFGGLAVPRDNWAWDGNNWSFRITGTVPPGRYWSAMAYDEHRDRVVMFSGTFVTDNDTWEYFAPVRAPATFTTFGAGCPGSSGTPVLAAGANDMPFIGGPFRMQISNVPTGPFNFPFGMLGVSRTSWGTLGLPLDLAFLAMPGCSLLTSIEVSAALPRASGVATMTIGMPYDATLVGQRSTCRRVSSTRRPTPEGCPGATRARRWWGRGRRQLSRSGFVQLAS